MKAGRTIFLALLPLLLAYDGLVVANEVQRARLGKTGQARIHDQDHGEHCGWICYSNTQHCIEQHGGWPKGVRRAFETPYEGVIDWLASGGQYRSANLLYLALLWPLMLSALAMRCLVLIGPAERLTRRWRIGILLFTLAVLVGVYPGSDPFTYLTDFMLTLSHWTGWSYFEVNTLVFIVAWPGLTALLLVLWPVMEWRQKPKGAG